MKITIPQLRRLIKEELLSESTFKVKDKVVALVGPHKGLTHEVIAVLEEVDGTDVYNIKPILGHGQRNKYRLGAASAREDQIKKEQ